MSDPLPVVVRIDSGVSRVALEDRDRASHALIEAALQRTNRAPGG